MTSRPVDTTAGAYQYNRLNYEIDGQIRVLVVDEGEVDAPITGSLQATTAKPESGRYPAPLLEWDANTPGEAKVYPKIFTWTAHL
jgi:hypothetical protein